MKNGNENERNKQKSNNKMKKTKYDKIYFHL